LPTITLDELALKAENKDIKRVLKLRGIRGFPQFKKNL
jgi:hypothetical protein